MKNSTSSPKRDVSWTQNSRLGLKDEIDAFDPTEFLGNEADVYDAFVQGLTPDPRYNVWQWAEAKRILTSKSSKETGPYRVGRTPFLREIMA